MRSRGAGAVFKADAVGPVTNSSQPGRLGDLCVGAGARVRPHRPRTVIVNFDQRRCPRNKRANEGVAPIASKQLGAAGKLQRHGIVWHYYYMESYDAVDKKMMTMMISRR